jgi:hypothetical protein
MTNLDFLKEEIKRLPPEDLESHSVISKAKTWANGFPTFICPLCGNGTGSTGDGLVVYNNSDGYAYHCNKSGCHFDNISLLAIHYNLDARLDFVEILRRAADVFGIAYDDNFTDYQSPPKNPSLNQIKDKKPLAQVYSDSALAQDSAAEKELAAMIESDIAFSIEYLAAIEYDKKHCSKEILDIFKPEKYFLLDEDRRGLTLETLRYFHCGYLPFWIHPKNLLEGNPHNVKPTRRLIIPISTRHYIAVALDRDRTENPKDKDKIQKLYWKMHAKTKDSSGFFGAATITKDTKIIIVTEGEIECMTLWQAYHYDKGFLKESMQVFGAGEVATENGEIIKVSSISDRAYIATSGAANKKWIAALDCICRHKGIEPKIIIMFDDDDAGKTNAENQKSILIDLGYPTITRIIKIGDKTNGERF